MFTDNRRSPEQYSSKGESVDFYDSTKSLWLVNLPLSLLLFFVFRALYLRFKGYKLASLIKPFGEVSCLFVSILG
jgi:hypothetical protein